MTDLEENPRFQPHVLVITGDTADEREFEVEHPDTCPKVCYWSPGMATQGHRDKIAGAFGVPNLFLDEAGHRDCYVQYEVEGVGLDSLDLGDDPPDDGTYTPASQWSMDGWRRLPPGRYIIEAWYTPSYWAGDYVDADGGLTLIGPA